MPCDYHKEFIQTSDNCIECDFVDRRNDMKQENVQMTPNKITDAEMEEMTRLAPIMAEFLGWEKKKAPRCYYWVTPFCHMTIGELVQHFFDPVDKGNTPNPRGFIQVLDRLDRVMCGDHRKIDFMHKVMVEVFKTTPADYITPLYRAVEQLMEKK